MTGTLDLVLWVFFSFSRLFHRILVLSDHCTACSHVLFCQDVFCSVLTRENVVVHMNTCRMCAVGCYRVLCFGGLTHVLWRVLSQRVKNAPWYTSRSLCAIHMNTSSRICESHVSSVLKIVQSIMVDPGTWYYPPVRLRCLYISNLGDQAAGLQSWSTQWLAINRLGSVGRAHPEQRFPCGYGLWHRGTCPQPSALIWQMILYQRPLHWFGW